MCAERTIDNGQLTIAKDGLYVRKEGLEHRKERLCNNQRGLLPDESFTPSHVLYSSDS